MKNKLVLMLIVLAISLLALTACGSAVFKVTFDLNYDGANDFDIGIIKGETLNQPFEPQREGYIFDGWFNEESCMTSFDFDVKAQENRIAYAKWSPIQTEPLTFTVNFVGEDLEDMTVTVNKGSTVYQPIYGQKVGYELTWYNGETEYDFTQKVNDNLTLTANWKPLVTTCTITFAGDDIEEVSINVNKGTKIYQPNLGQKEGYDLSWYNDETLFDFGQAVDNDLTLTAHWTVQHRTVTLLDFDETIFGEMLVDYGSSLTEEELTDELGIPFHEYEIFYEFDGIDGDLTEIKSNITVKPIYKCNCLPEEIFDFMLLPDDTYGIKIRKNQDFRALNLTGDYVMPSYFNGKPVSTILYEGMYSAYGALNGIYRLFIPETYRVIQNYAFKDFHAYQIVFAEGLEEIWANAFFYCSSMLDLPASLNYIEYFAFLNYGEKFGDGVVSTANVSLNPENNYYSMEDGLLVSADLKTLVFVNRYKSLQNLIIPETVEYIYPGLCYNSYALQTVTFEGNIKTIGAGAFANIRGLQTVNFNGTVERIEGYDAAYILKNSLSKEYLPVTGAFFNCLRISQNNFNLPSGLNFIGDFAFGKSELSSIILDGSIEHVGKGAFFADYGILTEIIVTEENDYYYSDSDRALIEKGTGINAGDTFLLYAPIQEDKNNAIDYVIPNGVTSLAPHAFYKAHYLNSLTIPEGVESIPGGFMESSLLEMSFDAELNLIETYYGIKTLILPSTLKEVLSYDYDWAPIFNNDFYPAFTVNLLETISWPKGCNIQKIDYWSIVISEDMINFEIPATVDEYLDYIFSTRNL